MLPHVPRTGVVHGRHPPLEQDPSPIPGPADSSVLARDTTPTGNGDAAAGVHQSVSGGRCGTSASATHDGQLLRTAETGQGVRDGQR